ncbi:MAG TPA: NUDIX hydrolase [Ktedonobacteraceae bacterium]|nr:NUDIX hydrolase [Ktedonobacteraceae bacterium]
MERQRTMRAYSAGGVVFRLVPTTSLASNRVEGQPEQLQPRLKEEGKETQEASQATGDIAIEVALVGRSHPGIWALPKGTPQPGETIEQVAIREVQEETGLQVRLIAYIGSISYFFVRNHVRYQKQVRHYLMEAVGGDTALHDQEYDRVEWFPIAEASRRLTYQNEVSILSQAEEVLQRWLQSQRKGKEKDGEGK